MITIENNKFRASFSETGAELQSFQKKDLNDYEYIWNDPSKKFWHRHSPVLFPATGKSNNDQYQLNGKLYPIMQHGFARDCIWKVVNHTDNQVTFSLSESDQTLKYYPFKFTIKITYTLNEKGLAVETEITNNGEDEMPFALGFHPAFSIFNDDNGEFNDYKIVISPVKGSLKKFSAGTVAFISGEVEDFQPAEGNTINLSHDLLDQGFILIANENVQKAELTSSTHDRKVIVELGNFPYLNIWSQEHANAPFICIEPFAGLPDIESDHPTDWYHKKGNTILAPGNNKEFHFQIEFS